MTGAAITKQLSLLWRGATVPAIAGSIHWTTKVGKENHMRKIVVVAAALSAVVAAPALGATGTVATYAVTGTVSAVCSANASGSISLGNLVDGTGTLNVSGGSASDTGAYCNGAGTTIQVAHTSLTTAGTASTGFTNTLTYSPKVTAGTTVLTGDQASGTSLGTFAGLTVEVTSLSASGNKPVAGSYSGSITVTLTPGA